MVHHLAPGPPAARGVRLKKIVERRRRQTVAGGDEGPQEEAPGSVVLQDRGQRETRLLPAGAEGDKKLRRIMPNV